ncbi:hypothetical protein [Akkermansia glycaniphila]|uniref:Uncharacterized protein n=1 Tax=Akkermansia glycaniphila TaxID=1679444 RepID=A0A1C7P9J6_9BACT|nr:hypothetical protein [Akkermansia glycaniphila]OCA02158.1 hypothetical protein AC781_11390 [Akkermansia glycaniphila]SEH99675.1 Hypothetical protein PYTT_2419 [Akkermansia glycaniphila]
MNNTYEIKDDGAIFFDGKKIGVNSEVGVDFVSVQARNKHAAGLAEWMAARSSGDDGGGSLLPDLPGLSGENKPEESKEGGAPDEKPEKPEKKEEGGVLPDEKMPEGEDEVDGPPPRDELCMNFNAAWLRWDFEHLPEAKFMLKWERYAEGNPANFAVFKSAAKIEFCYGL